MHYSYMAGDWETRPPPPPPGEARDGYLFGMEVPHGSYGQSRDAGIIQQGVPPLLDLGEGELAGELDAQMYQCQVTGLQVQTGHVGSASRVILWRHSKSGCQEWRISR